MADVEYLKPVSWKISIQISLSNLKRRLGRSLVTMSGVILGIAFLNKEHRLSEIPQSFIDPISEGVNRGRLPRTRHYQATAGARFQVPSQY